jgi:hypothetical protein
LRRRKDVDVNPCAPVIIVAPKEEDVVSCHIHDSKARAQMPKGAMSAGNRPATATSRAPNKNKVNADG